MVSLPQLRYNMFMLSLHADTMGYFDLTLLLTAQLVLIARRYLLSLLVWQLHLLIPWSKML